jgi:hypothetical protein
VRGAIARTVTIAAVLIGATAVAGCGEGGGSTDGSDTATTPAAGAITAAPASTAVPPVWPLPADPSAAAAKAGLEMLDREMLEVHYHAHLDVVVRGVTIRVPENIGIDVRRQRISPLHTHDTTGIVHIESGKDIPFTLGQLFTAWGQLLTLRQVGPVAAQAGEEVRVYRNGERVSGDPGAPRFASHDQIVVWLGPASERPRVPATYKFPEGL